MCLLGRSGGSVDFFVEAFVARAGFECVFGGTEWRRRRGGGKEGGGWGEGVWDGGEAGRGEK